MISAGTFSQAPALLGNGFYFPPNSDDFYSSRTAWGSDGANSGKHRRQSQRWGTVTSLTAAIAVKHGRLPSFLDPALLLIDNEDSHPEMTG